jgi:hypothetical protein
MYVPAAQPVPVLKAAVETLEDPIVASMTAITFSG